MKEGIKKLKGKTNNQNQFLSKVYKKDIHLMNQG